MDSWEVWDLAEEEYRNENGANNEFSPLLASHDGSVDFTKHEVYESAGEGSINGSVTTGVNKLEISITEEPGIVLPHKDSSFYNNSYSPKSPYLARSINSTSRTNSLSGLEGNNGLTSNYTLEEPGKEKRHVIVVPNRRKSVSSNASKSSRDRTSSVSEFEDDSLCSVRGNTSLDDEIHGRTNLISDQIIKSSRSKGNVGNLNLNSFEKNIDFTSSHILEDRRRHKQGLSVASSMHNSRSSSAFDTSSSSCIDGHQKYKTNKDISRSTGEINTVDRYSNNSNSQHNNGLRETPTSEKKTKSIFAKAKQFFKSPNAKTTHETKLDKFNASQSKKAGDHISSSKLGGGSNRSRNNSSSDDSRGLTSSYTVNTSNGEEKFVLTFSQSCPTSPMLSSKVSLSSNSGLSKVKMSSKSLDGNESDSSGRLDRIHCKSSDNVVKETSLLKIARPDVRVTASDSRTNTHASSRTSEEIGTELEEDYDIINLISSQKVDPHSNVGKHHAHAYDIVFKPEKPSENEEHTRPPLVAPLQEGLMALVVGVGLGEPEETKNVVSTITHPHSVEEHGEFQLQCDHNCKCNFKCDHDSECHITCDHTNGRETIKDMPKPDKKPPSKPNHSTVPSLLMNGLLLAAPAAHTDIRRDNSTRNMSNPSVAELDTSVADDSLTPLRADNRLPMTSTPIKKDMKSLRPNIVVDSNHIFENNGVQPLEEPPGIAPSSPKTKLKNKHVRNLKFEEEEYQRLEKSFKEQYGIYNIPNTTNDSLSTTDNDDSSISDTSDQNTTSDGSNEEYDMESDQVATMTDDSIDAISMNKEILLNQLSKLEIFGKIIHNDIDQCDMASPKRKCSTDSLASFEFHERELANHSLGGSPVYPLSPNCSTLRSPRRTANCSNVNGYLSSSSLNGFSSGPDSLDEEEIVIDFTDELTERRITSELLNYMPPIEEGSESCSEEDEEHSSGSLSPYECNHVRKESCEKERSSTIVNEDETANVNCENDSIERNPSEEQLSADMGAEGSKIKAKTKSKKGSSKKNSKPKKKKEKSHTTVSSPEGDEISRTLASSKVWTSDLKQNKIDKNGNFLKDDSKKDGSRIGKSDSVHIYNDENENEQHDSRACADTSSLSDTTPRSNSHLGIDKTNDTGDCTPTLTDNEACVIPDSDITPSGKSYTTVSSSDLVFDIPIGGDHSSIVSDDDRVNIIDPAKTNEDHAQSNRSSIADLDHNTEEHEIVDSDSRLTSQSIEPPNEIAVQTSRVTLPSYDADGTDKSINRNYSELSNDVEVPKKCLWYDYSKDEEAKISKEAVEEDEIITDSVIENFRSAPENIISSTNDNPLVESDTTEDLVKHTEPEGKVKPVVRSHSFGPDATRRNESDDSKEDFILEKLNICAAENYTSKSLTALDDTGCNDSFNPVSTSELVESGTTCGDRYPTKNKNLSKHPCDAGNVVNIDGKGGVGYLAVPKLIATKGSVESTDGDSGVEHIESSQSLDVTSKLKPKTSVISLGDDEDDEERDSGTELRYDDIFSHQHGPNHKDYEKWLKNIKPLLHDAELVANLYLRLANKYAKSCSDGSDELLHIRHLHSAQIAYEVIRDSNLTNFASVVSYLLSYMGALKSEKSLPDNISIPNLLKFLEQLIKRNTMTSEHVTMFTCFLSRPNRELTRHHDLRLGFLHTCFKQEVGLLNVNTEGNVYLKICFIKISEYFIQLDRALGERLTKECIIPHLHDQNSTTFVMNALTYMGLVKSEEPVVTTSDVTSSLILLDIIFRLKKVCLLTSQKLYAFIQLNNPRFRFCSSERESLTRTLQRAIDF